jgi:hypothetical protein
MSDTLHPAAPGQLREEIDYAINDQGLPVIVINPEYDTKESLLGIEAKPAVGLFGTDFPRFETQ